MAYILRILKFYKKFLSLIITKCNRERLWPLFRYVEDLKLIIKKFLLPLKANKFILFFIKDNKNVEYLYPLVTLKKNSTPEFFNTKLCYD